MDTRLLYVLDRHRKLLSGELPVARAYAMLYNDYRSLVGELDTLERELDRARHPTIPDNPTTFRLTCQYSGCGKMFTTNTLQAKFCPNGGRCRKAAHRARLRAQASTAQSPALS